MTGFQEISADAAVSAAVQIMGAIAVVAAAIIGARKVAKDKKKREAGAHPDEDEEAVDDHNIARQFARERRKLIADHEAERQRLMNDAREAWSKAIGDATRIATLEAEKAALQNKLTDLERKVDRMMRYLHKTNPGLVDTFGSSFGDLA